jgi:Fe-S-cluster containining protein
MLEFDKEDELFIGDRVLRYFGNCLDCGLCCKIFNSIEIADDEIQNIAHYLKMTKGDFLKRYTKRNRKHNALTKTSLKTPCQFQKSSRCTIHKRKPFDCKTFPLLINVTKGQAILTGIYLCPQATHFYQGFLDFCQHHIPSLYDDLISLEKETNWTSLGFELTISAKPLSLYIDWLYSDAKTRKCFTARRNREIISS